MSIDNNQIDYNKSAQIDKYHFLVRPGVEKIMKSTSHAQEERKQNELLPY
jgi:hypothetical protein